MTLRRDLLCRRRKQLLDHIGLVRGWFRELWKYCRGMPREEFWVRYPLGRMEAAQLWSRKPRRTETDYRAFSAETDYGVLRKMYYHRHDCFHAVATPMRRVGRVGDFCEYGGGVAPITAWLRPRFPDWPYT